MLKEIAFPVFLEIGRWLVLWNCTFPHRKRVGAWECFRKTATKAYFQKTLRRDRIDN